MVFPHNRCRARSRNTDELKAPDNVIIIIIIIIIIVNKSNTTILIMKTKYLFL